MTNHNELTGKARVEAQKTSEVFQFWCWMGRRASGEDSFPHFQNGGTISHVLSRINRMLRCGSSSSVRLPSLTCRSQVPLHLHNMDSAGEPTRLLWHLAFRARTLSSLANLVTAIRLCWHFWTTFSLRRMTRMIKGLFIIGIDDWLLDSWRGPSDYDNIKCSTCILFVTLITILDSIQSPWQNLPYIWVIVSSVEP
jgi:hypothetical protein